MRIFVALLVLAGTLTAAEAGKLRTNSYWGGRDLPVSCETVRQLAPAAKFMSAEKRRGLIAEYGISPKMIRQARACLK